MAKEEVKNPVAIVDKGNLTEENLKELKEAFVDKKNPLVEVTNTNSDLDSFFNNVLNQLYSATDIDMKSEYRDEDVIFATSVGSFLGKGCNIPMINTFLNHYDRRMVSKGRKGRTEIIMGLQRRQEAEEAKALKQAMQFNSV